MSRKALTTRKRRSRQVVGEASSSTRGRQGAVILSQPTMSQRPTTSLSSLMSRPRNVPTVPSPSQLRNNPALLDLLPAELVYGLCEQMDTRSLSNFVSTSQRHKAVCQRVLDQRREEYDRPLTLDKFIQEHPYTSMREAVAAGNYIGPPIYFLEAELTNLNNPNSAAYTRVVEYQVSSAKRDGDVVEFIGSKQSTTGAPNSVRIYLLDKDGYAITVARYIASRASKYSLVWDHDIGFDAMVEWNRRVLGE